eukprot:425038_1
MGIDDLIKNADKYNAQWILDQCEENQWGDYDEWNQSLNGFIAGWNHIAERVTTDKQKHNTIIDAKTYNDDDEDEKDDIKQEPQRVPMMEYLDNDNMDIFIRPKNPFRKFVVLQDTCETLKIWKIEPKIKGEKIIKACDVSLSLALDSEYFDSSKMIRFIIQHLVEANNRLLRIVYNLSEEDNGERIGLSPRLSTTELSQKHNNDVINIDEEELASIIQQCVKPRLRYGQDNKLTLKSFNLKLLETQLKQKYIIGRKFLKYDRVIFEFAGQHNIPLFINKINMKYRTSQQKSTFFDPNPQIEGDLSILEYEIEQNCENINVNAYDYQNNDEKNDEKKQYEKIKSENRTKGYKLAMQSVEQILIAIERLVSYPDPTITSIFDYMKKTLHLSRKDYSPFQPTKLQISHCGKVWRHLEKRYIECQGKWKEIPQIMDCYLRFIDKEQKQSIGQFIATNDMDKLWIFLLGYRRFMEEICKTQLSNPQQTKLRLYLQDVDDIDLDMIGNDMNAFPNNIMLSQIGHAYEYAAEKYQERLNDRKQ